MNSTKLLWAVMFLVFLVAPIVVVPAQQVMEKAAQPEVT